MLSVDHSVRQRARSDGYSQFVFALNAARANLKEIVMQTKFKMMLGAAVFAAAAAASAQG